ncbi:uncharacterized protein LOC130440472 [Diorhabda sublineata]|uniref:uncharacterized protein LOC130440472 n=1 Tax=Diorhabda sublineata TaxID=1163346 RepID=UPI0024E1360F|nr:uncharacterized protein LOC130440472 [Diorhabda sublineata]
MFIVKVVTILTLALLAKGSDKDTALDIMACARRAIENGVSELGIPSHSPVYIKENFSWTGDIDVASATLTFYDLVWAGLPNWNVSGTQLSNDSDAFAVFDFDVYWSTMVINGSVNASFTELGLQQDYIGNISTVWSETNWIGTINVTKPGFNLTEQVNNYTVAWTTETLTTTTEGFGLFGSGISTLIDVGVPAAIQTDSFSETMSDFLLNRLNSVWWSTGKIWELVEWCQENPESKS